MGKYIEVSYCGECPYINVEFVEEFRRYKCKAKTILVGNPPKHCYGTKMEYKPIDNIDSIPEWCPIGTEQFNNSRRYLATV